MITKNRKVLVMMSTYNGEKYLKEQLDSIYSQENCIVDILVRDDGSKDQTISILENYARKYSLRYYDGENLRTAGSFYDLILKAPLEYEYYAFSDQDDFWEKDKLSQAINKLVCEDKEIPCLYYSGQEIVDAELNILYHHNLETRRNTYANFLFNQVAGCTAVFNRKLLEYAKMNPKAKPSMHDSYMYRLCAALNGKFIVDSEGKILYRQHGNNVVGLGNSLKSKLKLFKEHLNSNAPRNEAKQIYEFYSDYMSDEWKHFILDLLGMKKSLLKRIKLLFSSKAKFYSIKIRMTYILKVFLNKL